MNKKTVCNAIALILAIGVIFSLSACADNNSNNEKDISITSATTAENESSTVIAETTDAVTTTKKDKSDKSDNSKSTSSSESKATTKKSKSTTKKTTKKSSKTTTTNSTIVTQAQTNSASDTKQDDVTTASQKSSVYITIECTAILSNMNDLKDGHESYVPKDGYILKKTEVETSSSDTAYDVLKNVCSDKSIKLSSTKSGYGYYVSGINEIDEKDCGKTSGWMYKVNDKTPSKSCSSYTASNGDDIVFYYVCKY